MKAPWSRLALFAFLAFILAGGKPAQADNYPTRAVKIISDSAPGSAVDVNTRIIANALGKIWNQQVLVVNQPGAGGAISARVAAEASHDGYTLYMPALSVFLAVPGKAVNLPLQLPHDFLPIGFATQTPMFITAAPSLGVKSIPELIAEAKKRPGQISYAATGIGRLTHLTGELLQYKTGIKLLLVPYSGGPNQAMPDIMGGRVAVAIEGYAGLQAAIQAGSLKAIAVGSSQRLAEFPDLPSVSETIPGFNAVGWQILLAPVGTSDAIIQKVSADLRTVVGEDEVKTQLAKRGNYVRPMSPPEVTAFVKSEQEQWKPILQNLAAKPK